MALVVHTRIIQQSAKELVIEWGGHSLMEVHQPAYEQEDLRS